MNRVTTRISPEEVARQMELCGRIAEMNAARAAAPAAFVDTYGCPLV